MKLGGSEGRLARVAGVRRAVVIGGGNTAIDVARELAGLGVPSVTHALPPQRRWR